MTILAPTSSPFRRQYAALITDNLRQINIDARLVYLSFGSMAALTFGCSGNCGKTYANGGFDANLVSFGGGLAIPDWRAVTVYKSSTNADYSPSGANYFFYHNDTYNQLDAQYYGEFNASARVRIAQQMVRIIAQDRPDMPLFYPVNVFGVSNYVNQWNGNSEENDWTVTRDFQHWGVSHGSAINVAEPGDITSVNQWATGPSYNLYDYLYNPTMSPLEELDARNLLYTKALAATIAYSGDHLTWYVKFIPHGFQDGVQVTSDDYLFTMMGWNVNDVGSVQTGTLQGLLGSWGAARCNCTGIRFTYLNGTTDFVWSGNFTHGSFPSGFITTSSWKAINDTTFSFTLSQPYTFTDPGLTSFAARPMHIFERIPFNQWGTSPFATLHSTPYVYVYNLPGQANHGGNGTGRAYGPIGDGPYYYHGYDSTNRVGTLVRWNGYWNASGLQRLGLFNATTIRVYHLAKDAAEVAFQSGQVNFLDDNYYFYPPGAFDIAASNGRWIQSSSPDSGSQDFVLQNIHPVFGTGTSTPNGQADPADAEVYARYVRAAISHAIPRQYIIDNFLRGIGTPGFTEICTCFRWAYPPDLSPDIFDLSLSLSLLAKAGYSLASNPVVVPPSLPQVSCSAFVNGSRAVSLPTSLVGNALVLSGTFPFPPALGTGTGGFYVTVQQSLDNGSTWVPVAMEVATANGYYTAEFSPTITGSVWYRAFFTGIPYNSLQNFVYLSPFVVESYAPPLSPHNGQGSKNITNTQYGPIEKLNVATYSELLQGVLTSASANDFAAIQHGICGIGASINGTLASFAGSVKNQTQSFSQNSVSKSDLTSAVSSLQGSVATMTNLSYAALVGALVVGVAAVIIVRTAKSGRGD